MQGKCTAENCAKGKKNSQKVKKKKLEARVFRVCRQAPPCKVGPLPHLTVALARAHLGREPDPHWRRIKQEAIPKGGGPVFCETRRGETSLLRERKKKCRVILTRRRCASAAAGYAVAACVRACVRACARCGRACKCGVKYKLR